MGESKATPALWRDISDQLGARHDALRPILDALARYGDETVYRVSAPYGTSLIQGGKFQWSLLGEHAALKQGYVDTPIPLGLVLSKSIELYDAGPPPQEHRFVPLYMVTEGEFFGLFENFAPNRLQSALIGGAGGATLLVLPRIGNAGLIDRFAKGLGWTCPKSLQIDVKQEIKSRMAFGEFFAKILEVAKTEWRLEIAVLPQEFVTRIRGDCDASLAMHELALSQMTVACARAETTVAMLSKTYRPDQGDVLAVRQIARGFRPGFVPVVGSRADELVLPAQKLHELVYARPNGLFSDWDEAAGSTEEAAESCAAGTIAAAVADAPTPTSSIKHDFYPAIFRPSLPGEAAYYFLKRPYGPQIDGGNASKRVENLMADLQRVEPQGVFRRALLQQELQAMLESDRDPEDASVGLLVHLGSSPLIAAGVVRVDPISQRETN